MGLSCGAVELIIHEHLYRPLNGLSVLLIGRQNTDITPQAMTNLLNLYGLSPRVPYVIERPGSMDHLTIALPPDAERIADVSVFRALADCQVQALDISDYEGAEIVHDLNRPLPEELKGRFDFIFDGSCLDNIFDGPGTLIKLSELLKPGGRLLLYNASNSAPTAYLQFSPDWFIDYFAVNNYADCKVYIHEFPNDFQGIVSSRMPEGGYPPQAGCFWHFDPLVMYSGQWGYQNSQIADGGQRYVYVIAEKGEHSTSNVSPVQMHYRGNDSERYLESARRFRSSNRPICQPRTGELFMAANISAWEVLYPISRWSRRTYPPRTPSPKHNAAPVCLPKPWRSSLDVPKALLEAEERSDHATPDLLYSEIADLVGRCRELQFEKEKCLRERAQLTSERDMLQTKCDQLSSERDATRDELQKMLASRSWRLTKPARRLRSSFSKAITRRALRT